MSRKVVAFIGDPDAVAAAAAEYIRLTERNGAELQREQQPRTVEAALAGAGEELPLSGASRDESAGGEQRCASPERFLLSPGPAARTAPRLGLALAGSRRVRCVWRSDSPAEGLHCGERQVHLLRSDGALGARLLAEAPRSASGERAAPGGSRGRAQSRGPPSERNGEAEGRGPGERAAPGDRSGPRAPAALAAPVAERSEEASAASSSAGARQSSTEEAGGMAAARGQQAGCACGRPAVPQSARSCETRGEQAAPLDAAECADGHSAAAPTREAPDEPTQGCPPRGEQAAPLAAARCSSGGPTDEEGAQEEAGEEGAAPEEPGPQRAQEAHEAEQAQELGQEELNQQLLQPGGFRGGSLEDGALGGEEGRSGAGQQGLSTLVAGACGAGGSGLATPPAPKSAAAASQLQLHAPLEAMPSAPKTPQRRPTGPRELSLTPPPLQQGLQFGCYPQVAAPTPAAPRSVCSLSTDAGVGHGAPWEAPPATPELPRPPEPAVGAWADYQYEDEYEVEHMHEHVHVTVLPGGAPYDQIGLILEFEASMKHGSWDKIRLAANPVGVSMRGPKKKVIKRIVQAWLALSPDRFKGIVASMVEMERRMESASSER